MLFTFDNDEFFKTKKILKDVTNLLPHLLTFPQYYDITNPNPKLVKTTSTAFSVTLNQAKEFFIVAIKSESKALMAKQYITNDDDLNFILAADEYNELIFDNIKQREIVNFLPSYSLTPPLIHTFFRSMCKKSTQRYWVHPPMIFEKATIYRKPCFEGSKTHEFVYEEKIAYFPSKTMTKSGVNYQIPTFIPVQYKSEDNLRWALVVVDKELKKMYFFVPDTKKNAEILKDEIYNLILNLLFPRHNIGGKPNSKSDAIIFENYNATLIDLPVITFENTGIYICYCALIYTLKNISTLCIKIPQTVFEIDDVEISYLRKYIAVKVFDYWTVNKKGNDERKNIIIKEKADKADKLKNALQQSAINTVPQNPNQIIDSEKTLVEL